MLLTPTSPNLQNQYFEKANSLPPDVSERIYIPAVTKVITAAMKLGAITESKRDNINLIVLQVFTGDIPPRDIQKLAVKWELADEKRAFKFAQHIIENLIVQHREYLIKKFGENYFPPDPYAAPLKPRDTTPKLDGNVVDLKS